MNLNDFMTWDSLGSFAGVVAAVTLIIQFTKIPLDRVWKIPTRFVVWVVALIILLAVEYFNTGTIKPDKIFLSLLNAVLVAFASMGAYEATFKKLEQKAAER